MFSKKRIGIGVDDFKKIIEDRCYFVDKSQFIEELINDGTQIKLFCRPRRFGKTLNMSMLKYFFDVKEKEENSKLFKGLYIESSPIMREQGKYPVIFFTMKGITSDNWESALNKIKIKIANIFEEFYEELYENLNEFNRETFRTIIMKKSNEEELQNSLLFLTRELYKLYKEKVILLIDEYDTPLLNAHENGYYEKAVKFFKGFYGDSLKTNEYLQMGVLTGIIRVAQAGIFSDLNNFINDTILDTKDYQNYFGFLENEVENALKYYEIDYHLEDVKSWYNGYTFGSVQVYNPWSILNFLRNRELKAYWVNTSSNYLIREILSKSDKEVFEDLEKLLNGGEIRVRINSNVEVHTNLNSNELYSLMLFSGYLTTNRKIAENVFTIRIPNREIESFLQNTFVDIVFKDSITIDDVKYSLIDRDLKGFEKAFTKLIGQHLSQYDIASPYENPYHMFLLGFFTSMRSDYIVDSNLESGYGRADIVLTPLDRSKTGYVLELKAVKKGESVEEKLEEATAQLLEKYYEANLEKNGISDIIKIAIVFEGKRVEFRYVE